MINSIGNLGGFVSPFIVGWVSDTTKRADYGLYVIAATLVLTERSVEKVIHSIFVKLGLAWETSVHKRVKAVILYLAEQG